MLLLSVGALEHGMIKQLKASAVEIVVDLGLFSLAPCMHQTPTYLPTVSTKLLHHKIGLRDLKNSLDITGSFSSINNAQQMVCKHDDFNGFC
jgi:hypothetical protein